MGRRFHLLILLFALGGVLAAVWLFFLGAEQASRSGEDSPLYSTLRHDPYGTAALLDLLTERGVPVRVLERSRLEKTDRGVLIQLLPLSEPGLFQPQRTTVSPGVLSDWIAAGNTVVQLTRDRTELMERLGVPAVVPGHLEAAREIEKHERRGLPPDRLPGAVERVLMMRDGPSGPTIELREPAGFSSQPDGDWHPLAFASGRAVIGEMRHGRGRLVVVGAPTPALNAGLMDGGNVAFLLELAGSGPVILDDWSHGIGHGGSVTGLLAAWGLLPVIAQVAFVLILYAWSTLGFRRVDRPPTRKTRSASEQVVTLGYLYGESLSPSEAAGRVRRETIHRVAASLRCPPEEAGSRLDAPPPELAAPARAVKDAIASLDRAARRRSSAALDASMTRALAASFALQTAAERKRGVRRGVPPARPVVTDRAPTDDVTGTGDVGPRDRKTSRMD